MTLHKITVRPVVTYASKTWILTVTGETAIGHLRDGSGGVSLGQCRIKDSRKEERILNYINYMSYCVKINRVKWAEYVTNG
jgi:hypothetical protein